jgi:hypothetical protein
MLVILKVNVLAPVTRATPGKLIIDMVIWRMATVEEVGWLSSKFGMISIELSGLDFVIHTRLYICKSNTTDG